jgi:outer membrane protein assembly factor BamD (BamD/ComL family)
MDSAGVERFRLEGYLPRQEFAAHLDLGLGRIGFMHKMWAAADDHYNSILSKYEDTVSAAEALYWWGVSYYKRTNDHTVLGRVSQDLSQKYPYSIWAKKASVWFPAEAQTKTA